jgi:hypothetical protein
MTPGNGSAHSKDPVAERRNLTSPARECWVVYMSDRVPCGTAPCKLLLIDFAARKRKVLIRARGAEGGNMRRFFIALAALIFVSSLTAAAQTPMQIYGAWHCGNDACTWATVRNMTDFDTKNHWIIDRGDGSSCSTKRTIPET